MQQISTVIMLLSVVCAQTKIMSIPYPDTYYIIRNCVLKKVIQEDPIRAKIFINKTKIIYNKILSNYYDIHDKYYSLSDTDKTLLEALLTMVY